MLFLELTTSILGSLSEAHLFNVSASIHSIDVPWLYEMDSLNLNPWQIQFNSVESCSVRLMISWSLHSNLLKLKLTLIDHHNFMCVSSPQIWYSIQQSPGVSCLAQNPQTHQVCTHFKPSLTLAQLPMVVFTPSHPPKCIESCLWSLTDLNRCKS